jgi:hypothetical protein
LTYCRNLSLLSKCFLDQYVLLLCACLWSHKCTFTARRCTMTSRRSCTT